MQRQESGSTCHFMVAGAADECMRTAATPSLNQHGLGVRYAPASGVGLGYTFRCKGSSLKFYTEIAK
jgi:hypothetical protein